VGVDPGARLRRAAVLVLAAGLGGCASGGVDTASLSSSSDAIVWDAAQKAYQKKQWDNARQYYKRIVDGFPNSEYGPGARLGLGQSYYEEGGTGNYVLAVAALREFLTLYPSHPRADFAQFLVAEAYYKQKNGPDRDQTQTKKALDEYERLLDIYASSSEVEKARNRIRECRESLARSEYLVGWFYQKGRQAWRAAILRYEGILSDYPDYEKLDEVLFRLSECLDAAGRRAEALPLLDRLLGEYPQSPYVDDARKLKDEVTQRISSPSKVPASGDSKVKAKPIPGGAPTPPPTPQVSQQS
jgi:outer membrane protein assembly factor BamD